MRSLIISHGHPDFSIGGAEVASYTLYDALNSIPCQEAFYLARAPDAIHKRPSSVLMNLTHNDRERFFQTEDWDEFWLSNKAIAAIAAPLVEYLKFLNPEVVHFHHVIGVGVEAIALVKKCVPGAKIVLTFHEYLSICHNHGQMIKRSRRELCQNSSPHKCQVCFPERSVSEFYERKMWLLNHFRMVDAFVSPSQFLTDRFVEWGLPREKFFVIDNGVKGEAVSARRIVAGQRRDRFAFFGQVSEFKGLHILLDAISRIPDEIWGASSLSVFGGNLEFQPEKFRSLFAEMLKGAGSRVRFCGSYRQDELSSLMRDVDWVVVPSIWWENSPVVIQEAFLHHRPLIVSGIGGMAEKVKDDVNGLHFRVGSAESLADQITRALNEGDLWERLSAAATTPLSPDDFAKRHIDLYTNVKSSPARRHPFGMLANTV